MSKPAKKRTRKTAAPRVAATLSSLKKAKKISTQKLTANDKKNSQQSRVVEMLRLPAGATIDAVMKATGWQQHSVRGFFAGVVQKKLGLKLNSEKVDGNRIYRIASESGRGASSQGPDRASA
jgi:hypothetical protein